jgi:hypothetical protein
VEVYNITCGTRDLIVSDCNVTESSYTSDDLLDGYIYEYTVTPRSNVEGASNGTSQTIKGKYYCQVIVTTILMFAVNFRIFSDVHCIEKSSLKEEYLNNG